MEYTKEQIIEIAYLSKETCNDTDIDINRVNECAHKIQVLNEVIISFGIQK